MLNFLKTHHMKLTFHGAAQEVTGSKHLLEVNQKSYLLDCGLFQGHRHECEQKNLELGFSAENLDALVLSHAHIDHSGLIPLLYKKGFRGPIYCTHATRDLCAIMLQDAAYIQEKDAQWLQEKKKNSDAQPLYTVEDAAASLSLFRSVEYGHRVTLDPNVSFAFQNAGHLLGSAMERWEIYDTDTKKEVRLGFTGDLGRESLPVLQDPDWLTDLDALITESTYGNRLHDEIPQVEESLTSAINQTVQAGGKILIPAFAVERTQELLLVLRELRREKKIPMLPIFIDSPLAVSATEIFRLHPECFDQELKRFISEGRDPFMDSHGVHFVREVEESKTLNEFPGSAIIISASGMCEFGRIRHHLANQIEDEKNLILIIGFMAEGTLGRSLVEGKNPVNIFGEPHPVKARIEIFNAFSGHADQKGLLKQVEKSGKAKSIFLVHGEPDSQEIFRGKIKESSPQASVYQPALHQSFQLSANGRWKS